MSMFSNAWPTRPFHHSPGVDTEMPWIKSDVSIDVEKYESAARTPEIATYNVFHLKKPSRIASYLIGILLLGTLAVYMPYYRSYAIEKMLTEPTMDAVTGEPASLALLNAADLVLVQTLDESLVPTSGKHKNKHGRLVIVGDVHGQKNELAKLLDEVGFDKAADHLILAGDMISKGPDSLGVLDLVMDLGATAVRGNHEDRVLLAYHWLQLEMELGLDTANGRTADLRRDERLPEIDASKKGREKDRQLARQLTRKQVQWLEKCPVILRVGDIIGMGEVVVVHAGLVPAVELHLQDPHMVMNMRTLDPKTFVPSESGEGIEWAKTWNHFQMGLEPHQRSTVVYGHYSKRGLQLREYSKGLDTGCLKGGRLTALVIGSGRSGAKQDVVHVNCEDGRA